MTKLKKLRMLPMAARKENLAVAFSIIGGIPAKNFHLDRYCSITNQYKTAPTCGTIGCTLGWLTMHPYFMAQGLYLSFGEVELRIEGSDLHDVDEASTYLFGRNAFAKYFKAYGRGDWDYALTNANNIPSWSGSPEQHKTLALARLKRGYKTIH